MEPRNLETKQIGGTKIKRNGMLPVVLILNMYIYIFFYIMIFYHTQMIRHATNSYKFHVIWFKNYIYIHIMIFEDTKMTWHATNSYKFHVICSEIIYIYHYFVRCKHDLTCNQFIQISCILF